MAAVGKTKKKVVNQQELRRLMREKQRAAAGSRRIESPHAKYNSLGHLSCVICSILIKNELLWQTHILGKQHKENLEKQRNTNQTTGPSIINTSIVPVAKRKGEPKETQVTKKVRAICESRTTTSSGLSSDVIDPVNEVSQQCLQQCSQSLVVASNDEVDETAEISAGPATPESVAILQKNAALPAPVQNNILPADFFDSLTTPSAVSHSGSIQKPEQTDKTVERKENTAEALPEGFFDDPVKDAMVRKVDPPKDQMDKEWEEFQKEIRQVNTVSEAIVAEDDEEVRLDRQIEEIDEQIMCYRRVEYLRDRQESVKQHLMTGLKGRKSQDDEKVDSDEEEELQEFLSGDWRAKGALL